MKCTNVVLAVALVFVFLGCDRKPTLPNGAGSSVDKTTVPVYPHADDWVPPHGTQYLKTASTCTACHGAKLDGGSTGISCKMCHTSYPHEAAWARPDNHGAAFSTMLDAIHKADGDVTQNECVTCHKPPAAGTVPGPGSAKNIQCNTCHVGVPHSVEMVTRDGQLVHHMEFGHSRALQADCLSCHRENPDKTRKYMPNLQRCTMCHSVPNVQPRVKWMSEDEANKVDAYLTGLRKSPPPP